MTKSITRFFIFQTPIWNKKRQIRKLKKKIVKMESLGYYTVFGDSPFRLIYGEQIQKLQAEINMLECAYGISIILNI